MEFTFLNSYVILGFVASAGVYCDIFSGQTSTTGAQLKQGYVAPTLKSSLQTSYGRHPDLVPRYEIFISEIIIDLFPIT